MTDVDTMNWIVYDNENTQEVFSYEYSDDDALPVLATTVRPHSWMEQYNGIAVNNESERAFDVEALLESKCNIYMTKSNSPQILIVHTHGTESYSADGAIFYTEAESDFRSEKSDENVTAVGKALADALKAKGISAIHCTILHDRVQYKDSYARAEETIRSYLREYPSIRLVIDLHRDSVIKSTGEIVRPVTLNEKGEPTAQVMCVVGSSWKGEENDRWEGNLALALKLRAALNGSTKNLCRPPYLRGETYNQEFAPYSLLLEIGASGNSLAEAKRAAVLVADALAKLIPQM
jgi:stage II sporulation protein P